MDNQPGMPLPQWQSHKRVWADKIVRAEILTTPQSKSVLLLWHLQEGGVIPLSPELKLRGGDPAVGGYYVRYEDGFESWSPAEAFEKGYTRIE